MTTQTVLRPLNGQTVSVSGTSAVNSTKLTSANITVKCDTACFIKFGDSDVEATTSDGGYDKHLSAGAEYDLATGGAGYIAIILASGTDTAYINEWTHKAI